MAISIKLLKGERGALIGQTGTGKSLLAKHYLLPQTGRLAILDPKGEFDFGGLDVFDTVREIEKRRPDRFIYRPVRGELRDFHAHDAIYDYLYERGDYFVYTDELTSFLTAKGDAPPAFRDIYARGRSRGITVLTATQDPVRIPLAVLRQARRFYTFRLVFPDDIKRMRAIDPGYTGKLPPKSIIDHFERVYGYRPKAQFAFRYYNAETQQGFTSILKDPNHAS